MGFVNNVTIIWHFTRTFGLCGAVKTAKPNFLPEESELSLLIVFKCFEKNCCHFGYASLTYCFNWYAHIKLQYCCKFFYLNNYVTMSDISHICKIPPSCFALLAFWGLMDF